MVNLETSVGSGGRPEPGKRFTFQAPATALTALAAAGVDVATMANNHALDFGRAALPSTFDAIDAAAAADPPLAVVGIGRDVREAFRPAVVDVDGTVVATLGATIADTDPTADPTGQWAATRRSRAAPRTPSTRAVSSARWRGLTPTQMWSSSTCTGGSRASRARPVTSGRWPGRWSGGVPTSSSAATRTGSRATGRSAPATWPTAWATTSGTPRRPAPTADAGVLTLTVQPASSPDLRASVTDAAWEPARIGADGLPVALSGQPVEDFRADLAEPSGVRGTGPVTTAAQRSQATTVRAVRSSWAAVTTDGTSAGEW